MSRDRYARPQPVIISMIVSLMLAIAPMPGWAEAFRPDWVTLTLIYWAMNLPRTYSIGWAWMIGLVLDVAQGTLLGQYALALSLVIYVTVTFHLQMRQFPTLQLSVTVFGLLALYQFILFWINGVAGVNTPAVSYWGPVLTGSLIWPLMTMLYSGVRDRARN
ncbi:MAG: rod shape-determining protein MreD [Proteobacteria bacterium]|nr:rod shape-determining protein MreD [Pseudomonadota bacterium]